MKVKLAEGVELEYVGGKLVLSAEVAAVINPKLDDIKAKIESGEIDLIKGTDLEKAPLLLAIEFLKAELSK